MDLDDQMPNRICISSTITTISKEETCLQDVMVIRKRMETIDLSEENSGLVVSDTTLKMMRTDTM